MYAVSYHFAFGKNNDYPREPHLIHLSAFQSLSCPHLDNVCDVVIRSHGQSSASKGGMLRGRLKYSSNMHVSQLVEGY